MYGDDHLTREELIALLDRQRRLENLLHATDVQLALLDTQFNFIWVNRAYAETCRMASEAMVGKNHFALYPDPENEAIFRQVRDTGEAVFHKDKPFIFPDQMERGVTYWDWSLAPHRDEAGAVTELVFSLRETTEFVRAEQTRRDTEAQYRLLFETMAQGVIHYGADDRVHSANPAAQRLLGLTLERMRGRTWPELFSQAIQEDGSPFPADAHPAQVALRTGQPVPATLMGVPNPDDQAYRWLRVHAIPQFQVGSAQPASIHVTFEDVTELMGAQATLRRREQQLRLALDAAHMASFEWDILRDEATNTRWGLNSLSVFPERMVDPIRQLTELIHPEDRAGFLAAIEAALTQPQGRYQTEFRVRDPSGRQVWLAEYGHVERDAEGRPTRLLGLTQNVTARKEAEEALRWSARRAELLSDTAARLLESDDPQRLVDDLCQQVMAFLDCQAFFNFLGDAPTGRLRLNSYGGISETQARQIQWLDYGVAVCGAVAREGRRILVEDIQHGADPRATLARSLGLQAYCCHPLLRQGRVLGTLSFGTRARPGFSPDEIAVMQAVTSLVAIAMHREETERALRDSEARYRALITASSEMIYRMSPDWTDMKQLKGRDFLMNTVETSDSWLQHYIPPDDRPRVIAAAREAIQSKGMFELEHRVFRADGSLGWVSSRAVPLLDGRGEILEWFGAASDITARKEAERQLEASLEEKILLVREVHHRVKNNLQVIVSLLSLQAAQVKNPEAQEGFRDMQRRIYSMAILHEALYKRGTMAGVDGAVYLAHLCEQLGQSFGPMQGRVCLQHRLSPVELTLDQAIPCGLIVNELVSNAYKHAFPGERRGQIQVLLEITEDGRRRLEVIDDGIGMPPGLNWENGSSLGLRLVPGLARQLGGELQLHNGAGTRFSITFPDG